MNKRLFVDVDDTLIKWGGEDGHHILTQWAPNQPVIEYVKRWVSENPGGKLIVWSSGGRDYAEEAGRNLLQGFDFTPLAKWEAIAEAADTFIDDDPWPSFAAATIHPRDVATALEAMP